MQGRHPVQEEVSYQAFHSRSLHLGKMSANSDGTVSVEMVEFLPSDSVKPVEPTATSGFKINIPPWVVAQGKIGLDWFLNFILPGTDEVTDLINGIRFFM